MRVERDNRVIEETNNANFADALNEILTTETKSSVDPESGVDP